MKKIITMMVLGIALGCLTGCGQTKTETQEVTNVAYEEVETVRPVHRPEKVEDGNVTVKAKYVSDEYLAEVAFNSQENNF